MSDREINERGLAAPTADLVPNWRGGTAEPIDDRRLQKSTHDVPAETEGEVVRPLLAALGVQIDSLFDARHGFLSPRQSGTG